MSRTLWWPHGKPTKLANWSRTRRYCQTVNLDASDVGVLTSSSRKEYNDSHPGPVFNYCMRIQLLHAYSIRTAPITKVTIWSYLRELGANAAEQDDLEARFSFLFVNNAISTLGHRRHGRCTFNDALGRKRHLLSENLNEQASLEDLEGRGSHGSECFAIQKNAAMSSPPKRRRQKKVLETPNHFCPHDEIAAANWNRKRLETSRILPSSN
ncbi:hypothetical protein V8E53_012079 [Lactarius tabidus]